MSSTVHPREGGLQHHQGLNHAPFEFNVTGQEENPGIPRGMPGSRNRRRSSSVSSVVSSVLAENVGNTVVGSADGVNVMMGTQGGAGGGTGSVSVAAPPKNQWKGTMASCRPSVRHVSISRSSLVGETALGAASINRSAAASGAGPTGEKRRSSTRSLRSSMTSGGSDDGCVLGAGGTERSVIAGMAGAEGAVGGWG